MDEIWLPVVGYEGLYEISNIGRVRSNHESQRRTSSFLKDANVRGYRMVMLCKGDGSKPKSALIHRLVALAFLGEPPPVRRPTVNHKNMDKADNRVENLEWLSHTDNNRHAQPAIKHCKGINKPSNKLSEEDVREIRRRYIPFEVSLKTLGKEYGVSEQTVHAIIHRKKWAHLD